MTNPGWPTHLENWWGSISMGRCLEIRNWPASSRTRSTVNRHPYTTSSTRSRLLHWQFPTPVTDRWKHMKSLMGLSETEFEGMAVFLFFFCFSLSEGFTPCRHLRPSLGWEMITWWMKLGGNLPPGDNPLLFSISGTGSFICPVA